MNEYLFNELSDMLLMYDYANGSGWKVVDLYQEMFQH
jgi:hypothetical protein